MTIGTGACVDLETTGFSPGEDEIIELAILLFTFERETGQVIGVVDEYAGLQEPSVPINRSARDVHGLCLADVLGHQLDRARVSGFLSRSEFLVAHNARFDHAFLAGLFPECCDKTWRCSMDGISWGSLGFCSQSLHALAADHGIAIGRAHRALDDARTVITLLSCCDKSGQPYLWHLLNTEPLQIDGTAPAAAVRRARPKHRPSIRDLSKDTGLVRLLCALDIELVGEETAYWLAEHFCSLDALRRARAEELEPLSGVSERAAASIVAFFSDEGNQRLIDKLREAGVSTESKAATPKKGGFLSGKKVVITGTLSGYERWEAEEAIRIAGGDPAGSVSRKTDFLVVGENPGSKLQRARDLGVATINGADFDSWIRQGS